MEIGLRELICIHIVALIFLAGGVAGFTNPNDAKVLNDLRNGLENGNLLGWPNGSDPCGPPAWPHVACSDGRITQIQAKELGLKGTLPLNLNQLNKLQTIALQKNQFRGKLPSLNGLSNLQSAFLDYNQFDMIPADFFDGLSCLRVLSLDRNPLNQSTGWSIPGDVATCVQLVNFSCLGCNIAGPVPEFFGTLSSLSTLRLSNNRLTGGLPLGFRGSMLKELMLNDQAGDGLTVPIGIIVTMPLLTRVWLHKNQFTGAIPDNIGRLNFLTDLNLNENRLVGLIPQALANMKLSQLDLSYNMFIGPIPLFKAAKVSYNWNSFCQPLPGVKCAPEVSALLDFLCGVFYPAKLSSEWTGNYPCNGPWWGITCNSNNQVSVINLKDLGLNGTLSPSLGYLPGLVEIHLEGNNLKGKVPASLPQLKLLTLLNLSGNAIDPALPKFRDDVNVILDHPRFTPGDPSQVSNNPDDIPGFDPSDKKSKAGAGAMVGAVVGIAVFAGLIVIHCRRKRNKKMKASSVMSEELYLSPDVFEAKNLVFSLQVLKKATNNFSKEHELGHGGFGVVYKGVLDDGRKVAVKRMQSGAISNKAMGEFQSEITVLSKVRHRHLVSLLGYCVEGNERLLVYEHMIQGALSKHLFHWRKFNIQPLPWAKRLIIALDVARGVQYLHSLAHQSFIHRDLKSANILLDDDFRAKVSDFGLVKLAPDKEKSVVTRLAGTFGYLAPEYAVTGKITTKVDVFSFGIILMELLTGLQALDERRPEEQRYLAEWFGAIKSNRDTVLTAIDPALDAKEDIHESILEVAELAGHCTERDANHRPEMGHAVSVLTKLVETWQPCKKTDEDLAATESLPLPQLLKSWQEEEDTHDLSSNEGSIPSGPLGFTDTFGSADAR